MDIEKLKPHTHNGTDSPRIQWSSVLKDAQLTLLPESSVAGATYTATEEDIINRNTTKINALIAELARLGILK